jgi:hypothetical protein
VGGARLVDSLSLLNLCVPVCVEGFPNFLSNTYQIPIPDGTDCLASIPIVVFIHSIVSLGCQLNMSFANQITLFGHCYSITSGLLHLVDILLMSLLLRTGKFY